MPELTSKDIAILENALVKAVSVGCKECGFPQFSFQAGLSLEKKCKTFLMQVECGKCGAEYTDILAVREYNEPVKYNKQ